ncbi:MAG: hypothetical protein KKC51_04025, partial [Verrucomicrobia bacterium]|nr:hypothetical protein [Verrucomicrobiota bacterium]
MGMSGDPQTRVLSGPPSEAAGSRFVEWSHRHFMFVATVFLLVVYMLTYLGEPFGPPINADGAGYYAYLPSLILYGDPGFETDAQRHYGGEFPTWTYVRRYPPTGRYLNALNMGVSMMMLPFFLAGHALTYWFGWPWDDSGMLKFQFPPDGYSLFYQHAAGLAGLCYLLLGLALLKRLLDRLFPRGVVVAALAGMLLGTNLLFYGAYDTVTAHPYTFFLFAALIALTEAWYRKPGSRRTAAGLGVVLALLVLVRPLNALLFLWVPLFGLTTRGDVRTRAVFFLSQWRAVVWMGIVAFIVMLPQFLMWKYSSGRFIVRAYQHVDAGSFGAPQFLGFLFGVRRGLFIWFPIFIAAVAGFFVMRGGAAAYRVPGIALLVAYVVSVSSLKVWMSADGFGNRYVVDMVIFMAFPLAAFYAALKSRWARWSVGIASLLAVIYTLFLLTLLYRREVSVSGISAGRLFDIFWWRWKLLQ